MKELDGQVAIVTGGASGIGLAVAQALAMDGAKVLCLDRNKDAVERLPGAETLDASGSAGTLEGIVADITDLAEVERVVADIATRFGRIDILINNAGISGRQQPLWETSVEHWRRMYEVHTHGTFHMMRTVIPYMMRNEYGRIVNVASIAGKEGNARSSAYSSAKAAVIGMTKSVGKELAGSGVLVNVVTPTVILTPMNSQVDPDYHEALLGRIPMGRPGQPTEVANLVRFVASPRCSFSTGAVFDISGGRATY